MSPRSARRRERPIATTFTYTNREQPWAHVHPIVVDASKIRVRLCGSPAGGRPAPAIHSGCATRARWCLDYFTTHARRRCPANGPACEIWLAVARTGTDTRLTDEGWATDIRCGRPAVRYSHLRGKLGDVSSVSICRAKGRVRRIDQGGQRCGSLSPGHPTAAGSRSSSRRRPPQVLEMRRTASRRFPGGWHRCYRGRMEQRLCLLEVAAGRLSTLHHELSFYSCS